MKITTKNWTTGIIDVGQVILSLVIPLSKAEKLPKPGTMLSVEVIPYKSKRSLRANAYCWKLCDEIAGAVHSTKEEVYRTAIKEVGDFLIFGVRKKEIEKYERIWNARGVGWFIEKTPLNPAMYEVHAYYGSSLYDTKKMARLIDWLIEEAAAMGLDVATPQERLMMLEEWEYESLSTETKSGSV